MRLPFFHSKGNSELVVPLPEQVRSVFQVYFRSVGTPPSPEALKKMTRAWIFSHATEPLRALLGDYLETPMFTIAVEDTSRAPTPPFEMIEAFRPGEVEQSRFEEATHVATIVTDDMLRPPRPGLWAAMAASRALVDALNGVAAAQPGRLLPVKDAAKDLPADGRFAIGRIIVVPFSVDKKGKCWMTTGGLHEFGLPELQVKNFPPNVQNPLGEAVMGIGQIIVRELLRQADHRDNPLKTLTLGREITVTLEDIAEAIAKPPKHKDTARGFATVGIQDKALRDGFLTIAPPDGTRIEQGAWINRLLMDLFGMVESVGHIYGGDERMEIAHRRAVAELPVVRRRFLDGLPPGAKLYLKHGFPVQEDEYEYMWIVVDSWDGEQISGQLSNNPRYRLDLRVRQAVSISEEDVFDWMIAYPDGREEGDYTTRILMED